MDRAKIKKLENQGWTVGNVDDFLDLSAEELAYIDLKIALGEELKKIRETQQKNQSEFAEIVGTSQSRLATLEAGSSTVTIDRQIKALIANGKKININIVDN